MTTTPRPQPTFFGKLDRPLFGWIHRVAGAQDRFPSAGLVLCNPFGYEAISSHRTLKHFAEAAAAAGIPALRFDYDGTGDSAGGDLDPGRWGAWLDSIHQAIDTLRHECGCERIYLLGIRLGATLAAVAASTRRDIAGLIAIAPVVNAKAYVREMRALQMATTAGAAEAGSASANAPLEVTGFVLSTATRNELAQIDLAKLTLAPAPAALVLDRSDLPVAERWYQHLRSCGVSADYHSLPGYVEMMLSPHSAKVPEAMLHKSIEWLTAERTTPASIEAPPLPQTTPASSRESAQFDASPEGAAAVLESVEFLDPDRNLFGVLALPAAARPQTDTLTAVLLLNAGGTHHIGPNRMYVALARRWASLGHPVLRMDISGIGDSRPWPGEAENMVYTSRAIGDIEQAARYLRERTGATKVRAVGLCAGAYHAFKAAVRGAPLDTVVMINPLTFFWKEGMSLDVPNRDERILSEARRYQDIAFSLRPWLKLLRGDVNIPNIARVLALRVLQRLKCTWRNIARPLGLRLRDDLARELELVTRRHVALRFVFAARDPGVELLETQGGSKAKALRKHGLMSVQIIEDADHTFTVCRARERLISVLSAELEAPTHVNAPTLTAAAEQDLPAAVDYS